MIVIKGFIVPKWQIKGFENYVFSADGQLYNMKTGRLLPVKIKGGYTRGYNLKGSFKSLVKLKPLIELYNPINCPF